jgi:hypothetical protein
MRSSQPGVTTTSLSRNTMRLALRLGERLVARPRRPALSALRMKRMSRCAASPLGAAVARAVVDEQDLGRVRLRARRAQGLEAVARLGERVVRGHDDRSQPAARGTVRQDRTGIDAGELGDHAAREGDARELAREIGELALLRRRDRRRPVACDQRAVVATNFSATPWNDSTFVWRARRTSTPTSVPAGSHNRRGSPCLRYILARLTPKRTARRK